MARHPWQPASSWLEQLVGACFLVLLCALALHVAAELILSVWPVLVSAGGLVLLITAAVVWWRGRSSGW
jgi:hypothetical protein